MTRGIVWLVGLGCAATVRSLGAQGAVITGASFAQLIELRPLMVDSVPRSATDSAWGLYRQTANGVLVRCSPGDNWCRYQRSAAPTSLVAMIQDLDVAAWGLGAGISAHAQLRARTAVGDARQLWPQARQTFDVLAAYVDVDRTRLRARLGRQWLVSGLGMFNFDGAAVTYRPWAPLSARAYGGGSLVEGLNRPIGEQALSPVEDLPPIDRAYLIGASLTYRPSPRGAISAQYQREIRRDRGAFYSERIAADGELHLGRGTLGAQMTHDLASGVFNDVAAQWRMPVRAGLDARVEVRHYTPYFDLWTIWGAFSPVGYNEARGDLLATVGGGRLSLAGDVSRREYEETHTGVQTLLMRTDGWRVGGSGAIRLTAAWQVRGSYHLDIGFGASRSDGDLGVNWQPSDALELGVHGVALENVFEFRVGTGRVIGGGVDGTLRLAPDLRASVDATIYRHTGEEQAQLANWNQRRASVRLEWTIGAEPGVARSTTRGGTP